MNEMAVYYGSLIEAFAGGNLHFDGSGEVWSQSVFTCFEERAGGLRVHYRGNRDRSEWLCDLMWLKGDVRCADFGGVELALECEWARKATQGTWSGVILEDLHKLLAVRAPRKVFVYEWRWLRNAPSTDVLLRPAVEAIDRHAAAGEDYLVVLTMPPPTADKVRVSCVTHGTIRVGGIWTRLQSVACRHT